MHVLRLVTDWSRRPSLTNGKDIVSFKISVIRKKVTPTKKKKYTMQPRTIAYTSTLSRVKSMGSDSMQ